MFTATALLFVPFTALLQGACGERTGSTQRHGISFSPRQELSSAQAKICRKREDCPRTMMCEWPLSGPDVWVCRPPEWYTDRRVACNLRGAPPCPAEEYCLLFEPDVPEYPGKCISKDLPAAEASKMKQEMRRCRNLDSISFYVCPRDLWCVPSPPEDRSGLGQCLPHDEVPEKYLEILHAIDHKVNIPCTGLGSSACPKRSGLYCAPSWAGERKQPDGPNRCLTRRQIDVKWIDQIFKIETGNAPRCGVSRAGRVDCPNGMKCVPVWAGPPIRSEEPYMCVKNELGAS